MPISCPVCKSRNLRYSRTRSIVERIWTFFGVHPLRCRDCQSRFIERTWRIATMKYARCPRCWRLDLSRWSINDYYTSAWTRILLRLGGHPYRCEYCRTNFVSFRRRKERYRAHKRPQAHPVGRTSEQEQ